VRETLDFKRLLGFVTLKSSLIQKQNRIDYKPLHNLEEIFKERHFWHESPLNKDNKKLLVAGGEYLLREILNSSCDFKHRFDMLSRHAFSFSHQIFIFEFFEISK
jgi:hypothetical protein